jgi:elongation factor G
VIKVAIEPKTKVDQEKMATALGAWPRRTPPSRLQTNEETGQTEISGMGELHLEVLVDRMLRGSRSTANVGRPQVSYRETSPCEAHKVEGKFVARPAARASNGVVRIDSSPPRGRASTSSTRSGVARSRRSSFPAVEKGIEEALDNGVVAGYPIVDVRVTLVGRQVPTRWTRRRCAFKVAGSMAFQEAVKRAKPVLLEPIFAVEGRHSGGVRGRGHRRPLAAARPRPGPGAARKRDGGDGVRAVGRDVRLRHRSAHGHAGALPPPTMQFERYDEVPPNIAEKIVEQRQGAPVPA